MTSWIGSKWGQAPCEGVKWALEAPRDQVELALFDLRDDAGEHNNVANEAEYVALADWFRDKLGKIVLGDERVERVESDWKQENRYAISDFATGAHDGKLEIPSSVIPTAESVESFR